MKIDEYYKDDNPNATLEGFLNEFTVSKTNYSPEDAHSDPVSGMAFDLTYSLSEKNTLYSQFGFLIIHVFINLVNLF